jgi:hypothetical protein
MDAGKIAGGMSLREKALYHQIHPLKLATDIGAGIVSLVLFWRHAFWLGLAVHLIPPIIASALIMALVDHEPLKASPLGRYIERHMTRAIEGARLLGDLIMVAGAWFHVPWVIGFGLIVVIGAWLHGRLAETASG